MTKSLYLLTLVTLATATPTFKLGPAGRHLSDCLITTNVLGEDKEAVQPLRCKEPKSNNKTCCPSGAACLGNFCFDIECIRSKECAREGVAIVPSEGSRSESVSPTPSLMECVKLCLERDVCKYFTFDEHNLACNMSSKIDGVKALPGAHSGTRECDPEAQLELVSPQDKCLEQRVQYKLKHVLQRLSLDSASECAKHCLNVDLCEFWTFNEHKHICALACVKAGERERHKFTSGSKQCLVDTGENGNAGNNGNTDSEGNGNGNARNNGNNDGNGDGEGNGDDDAGVEGGDGGGNAGQGGNGANGRGNNGNNSGNGNGGNNGDGARDDTGISKGDSKGDRKGDSNGDKDGNKYGDNDGGNGGSNKGDNNEDGSGDNKEGDGGDNINEDDVNEEGSDRGKGREDRDTDGKNGEGNNEGNYGDNNGNGDEDGDKDNKPDNDEGGDKDNSDDSDTTKDMIAEDEAQIEGPTDVGCPVDKSWDSQQSSFILIRTLSNKNVWIDMDGECKLDKNQLATEAKNIDAWGTGFTYNKSQPTICSSSQCFGINPRDSLLWFRLPNAPKSFNPLPTRPVSMTNGGVWFTGSNQVILPKSFDFQQMKKVNPPRQFLDHCAVQVNKTHTLFIGGRDAHYGTYKCAYLFDWQAKKYERIEHNMHTGKFRPECALFEESGKTKVLVMNQYSKNRENNEPEVLDLEKMSWTIRNELKWNEANCKFRLVQGKSSSETFLVTNSHIWQLEHLGHGQWSWSKKRKVLDVFPEALANVFFVKNAHCNVFFD